jgi:starch-binding outer membrane protein, SusD/RagB family
MTPNLFGAAGLAGRKVLLRVTTALSAAAVLSMAACKDSNVPYFVAPTSVPTTLGGVQNATTGLFSATRNDVGSFILFMSTFARDVGNFTNTEDRFITELMGISQTIPGSDFFGVQIWDVEFRNAKQANDIAAAAAAAGLTSTQVAAITGVTQTMKALNFIYLAETRDTLGVPIYSIVSGVSAAPYCNKDVWAYIVALLDSGNANLNIAGATALPITLPSGFGNVDVSAAPSTATGSFASFNRALAAKAGLELAYAIARGTGAGPTPTSPGTPDVTALTRADSAMKASALFVPAALGPFPAGGFTTGFDNGVYHVWSAQSGDQVNPINAYLGTTALLWDLVTDVDTVTPDARWAAKSVAIDPANIQEATYNPVAAPFNYASYPSVSTPIPILRNEELTLVEAQIRLGLGDLTGAMTYVNDVHTLVGGYGTPIAATTYAAVRDSLLNEQRISTLFEGSEDRTISIRFYGLAAVADTTWNATSGPDAVGVASVEAASGGAIQDYHTTVMPIPTSELNARNNNYALTCP